MKTPQKRETYRYNVKRKNYGIDAILLAAFDTEVLHRSGDAFQLYRCRRTHGIQSCSIDTRGSTWVKATTNRVVLFRFLAELFELPDTCCVVGTNATRNTS